MDDGLDGGVTAGTPSNDSNIGGTTGTCHPGDPQVQQSPPPPPITIRVSIFFDGTGNNRANTAERPSIDAGYNPAAKARRAYGVSYDNDDSNIAILEQQLDKDASRNNGETFRFDHIYVEGIGTRNNGMDDARWGLAKGEGRSGVKAKVQNGFDEVVSKVQNFVVSDKQEVHIELDAYGFSRGAAAARFFVYQVFVNESGLTHNLQNTLKNSSPKVNVLDVNVNFVGLFDTVASLGDNHSDDTRELNLDCLSNGNVSTVFQIASADEHRLNFPLTNIDSARGKGKQVFLPCVHADIGGGYRDASSSDGADVNKVILEFVGSSQDGTRVNNRFDSQKQWLIDQGWYLDGEFTTVHTTDFETGLDFWSLQVNRSGIKNSFSLIPLQLMAKYTQDHGKLVFKPDLSLNYFIPVELAQINNIIMAKYENFTDYDYWRSNSCPDINAVRPIRHGFSHFTATYDSMLVLFQPMIPQFYMGPPAKPVPIGGHGLPNNWADSITNRFSGERRRVIYIG